MRYITICLLMLTATYPLRGAPFAITDLSVMGDTVSLRWESGPERAILSYCPSLATGEFACVGSVLATNAASYSNEVAGGFYRIREVNVITLPDPNFEAVVRVAVGDQSMKYEPADEVYDIDADPVTTIDATGKGVSDVTGVELFSSLIDLRCSLNNLTDLDISANTNLTELRCQYNSLTTLDISANTKLTLLDCGLNSLTNLNVSASPNLTDLRCNDNNLTDLDLSVNTELTTLWCFYNGLTNLDVSANTQLTDLYCANNSLTNLDLSANTNLTYLICWGNPIVEIIVADTNNLPTTFVYDGNPIIREL